MSFEEALALHKAGALEAAEAAYRRLLSQGTHALALGNLGLILKQRGAWAEAEDCLSRAASAAPQSAKAVYNLGNLHQQLGRLEAAAGCFEAAIRLGGGDEARLNLGNVQLALGRYAGGWANYDARPARTGSRARRLSFPEWAGESLAGKRLFVWPEQGLGDQILAARFVAETGAAHTTLVGQPELARLFHGLPAEVVKLQPKMNVVPHDYWSAPLSLPRWVGRIPTAPYLTARPRPAGGRIGVVWSGNAQPDPLRSMTPEAARRLLALPGVVSLHPRDTGAPDFQATAELMAGLDLVISIDTSAAHLAGALGVPGVVLLHAHAYDWRWRADAAGRAVWYPSVDVWRQPSPGDWMGLIDRLDRRLRS